MFCEQCEQTASGQGCHQWGACGKSPAVNGVQDLLVYCLRSLAPVALKGKELGLSTLDVDRFSCEALFTTMTNVNFDKRYFANLIRHSIALREDLKTQIAQSTTVEWPEIVQYQPDFTESLAEQGETLTARLLESAKGNPDIFALKLLVLYGAKGMASYAFHAYELGQEDPEVYQFCYEALHAIDQDNLSLEEWVALALKVGEMNLKAMACLDAGHTQTYGHPVPTTVPLNPKPGKAILVSGHDIKQLAALLEQTLDSGITVYTHGELLPAHGYPQLKERYSHLYGHYGTAWQNQTRDFAKFPGPVVITTNCLMPPHEKYEEYLYTVGPVGFPGIIHLPTIDDTVDYSLVISRAKTMKGFTEETEPRQVMTGFARNAVLSVSDTIIDAVKQGKIRHFFLVGGCDGAKPDRNYYTEFVEKVPQDCVVMTLACGKFRFFDQQLGTIGDIPRLLDVGQCNDAYSAIQIALGLANAFEMDVNQLPLSMVLSWYEQKAIAVLLTLLYLGIKDIRLGPTLPAFLTPNVFKLLADTYNLQPISTPDEDLAACLTGR